MQFGISLATSILIYTGYEVRHASPNVSNTHMICRRCQSTFLQTVDNALQFSTSNPLYEGTHWLLDVTHASTGESLLSHLSHILAERHLILLSHLSHILAERHLILLSHL